MVIASIGDGVLLRLPMSDFGITGRALNWLRSFVTQRTQYIGVGTARSTIVNCTSDVHQAAF